MDPMLLTTAGLGFVLGLRHSLDPDHLAAVSTIVTEQRSLGRSSLVGGFWGLGHALALLAASGAVLALRLTIPDRLAHALETGVAVMLVLLGVRALRTGVRGVRLHAHRHVHDGREHVHLHLHRAEAMHVHEHAHGHLLRSGLRPFAVGLVHGLAGSAGLALIVVGAGRSLAAGLLYTAMLGLGALVSMLVLSALFSLPLHLMARRYRVFTGGVQVVAGLVSIGFGFWLFGAQAMGAGLPW